MMDIHHTNMQINTLNTVDFVIQNMFTIRSKLFIVNGDRADQFFSKGIVKYVISRLLSYLLKFQVGKSVCVKINS